MNKKDDNHTSSTTDYVKQFRGIVEFERRLREIEITYQQMQLDLTKLENRINSFI